MDVRKILKLTWFLVLFFVSGCFYVPKTKDSKNENCELVTKKGQLKIDVNSLKVAMISVF